MTKVERKTRCPLTISGLGGRALENRIPRWSGEIRVDENLGGGKKRRAGSKLRNPCDKVSCGTVSCKIYSPKINIFRFYIEK